MDAADGSSSGAVSSGDTDLELEMSDEGEAHQDTAAGQAKAKAKPGSVPSAPVRARRRETGSGRARPPSGGASL